MLGAIIGDVVGSRWEGSGSKNPDFEWNTPHNVFTDDTLCTVAVAQWLLAGGSGNDATTDNPHHQLRQLCAPHANRGFGGKMRLWLRSRDTSLHDSWGNGAVMRVSPVALWAQDDHEAQNLAFSSTHPTHAHMQSVQGAQAIAWAIRHAFAHKDPQKLLREASALLPYGDLTTRALSNERAKHVFDLSTAATAPLAILCATQSGGFEQAICEAVAMGGDADTLAAVAGSIAEGLYGIPQHCVDTLFANPDFGNEPQLLNTVRAFYAHPRVQDFHQRNARSTPLVPSAAPPLKP